MNHPNHMKNPKDTPKIVMMKTQSIPFDHDMINRTPPGIMSVLIFKNPNNSPCASCVHKKKQNASNAQKCIPTPTERSQSIDRHGHQNIHHNLAFFLCTQSMWHAKARICPYDTGVRPVIEPSPYPHTACADKIITHTNLCSVSRYAFD